MLGSGPALQSNSSNCLVLKPYRQLGMICLVLGRAMAQQPNISKTQYKSMFDTYQVSIYSLRPSTPCCTESWYQSYSSDVSEKTVSSWHRNSGPSPDSRMDTREIPATKAAAPGVNPEIYVLQQCKELSLTQEMVLAQTDLCCLLSPKNERGHM